MTEYQLLAEEIDRIKATTSKHFWIHSCIFLFINMCIIAAALLFIPPDKLQDIQKLSATPTPEADLLKLAIPLAIVMFGFAISFLGLKRLEQFDSEINQLRKYLSSQLLEERKLNSQDRETFRSDVNNSIDEFKLLIKTISENYINQAFDLKQSQLQCIWEQYEGIWAQYDANFKATVDNINTLLSPYRWLEDKKDEVDYLIDINTVGIAERRVSELYAFGKKDIALRIAEYVKENKLPGDANDYHNLGTELARQDNKPLAGDIVDLGLTHFADNIDLLASGLKYHSESGQFDRADTILYEINNIPKTKWNWRAFNFVGDYLFLRNRVEEALALFEEFRVHLPFDERAYSIPGQYYHNLGQLDKAIAILETGVKKCKRCSKTSLFLARCYIALGEYEKAIAATNKSLESTADTQPSVNVSSIYWHRALAYDAIIHRDIQLLFDDPEATIDPSDEFANKAMEIIQTVQLCLNSYITALRIYDCLPSFREIGPERIKVLLGVLVEHRLIDDDLHNMFKATLESITPRYNGSQAE